MNEKLKWAEWEYIGDGTHRMKVPGGWLVKIESQLALAMVFVKDDVWIWRHEKWEDNFK